jgi:hypothetical protein
MVALKRRFFLSYGVLPPLVWIAGAHARSGGHGHARSGNQVKISPGRG